MPKIFISYRRADSRHAAGRIYDRLTAAFGKDSIFKDVDNIPLGSDFRGAIMEGVTACNVVLVLIGSQWMTIGDDQFARRIDNPADFVRLEVETALMRDSALVIPVLVDNARMPPAEDLPTPMRELSFKNATVIRDDPDFHRDVTRLIESIEARYAPAKPAANPPLTAKPFNSLDAIRDFYGLMDASNWAAARELLALIRQSGNAPRYFDIEVMEKRVLDAADAAEAEREYAVIRLMARREQPAIVQAALRVFWETYPNYDPDHIATSESPSPTPKELLTPSVSAAVRDRTANAQDEIVYSVVAGSNYGVSLPLALAETIAGYIGTSTNAEAVTSRFASGALGVVVENLDHNNAAQLVAQLGEVGILAWVAQSKGGYSLSIADVGPKKINMIKAVRKILALGLKEAKDLVESGPPILVLSNLPHDEAVRLGRFFTDESAKIQIVQ